MSGDTYERELATYKVLERVSDCMSKWRDKTQLQELYIEKELSTIEIAERLGCTSKTISTWLKKHNIKAREKTHNLPNGAGDGREHPNWNEYMTYRTRKNGYEVWNDHKNTIGVHRLAAIAWYGFESVMGNEVHHKNEIPWDNRCENLQLLSESEHSKIHAEKKKHAKSGEFA